MVVGRLEYLCEFMENRFRQALHEDYNKIGLAAFAALSVVFLTPIPLFVGLGLETLYLLFFPDSALYDKILLERQKKDILEYRQALKEKVFPRASHEFVNDYNELESARSQLDDEYERSNDWKDVIDRLDLLLNKYLEFALLRFKLEKYISGLSEQAEEELPEMLSPKNNATSELRKRLQATQKSASEYSDSTVRWVETQMSSIRLYFESQIMAIQQLMTEEEVRVANGTGNINNLDTLRKRIDIQRMMLNQAEKMGQGLTNLNHQMALMAETINLINGQVSSKQPGQVLSEIENLVDQSETVSNFLQDLTAFSDTESQQILLTR